MLEEIIPVVVSPVSISKTVFTIAIRDEGCQIFECRVRAPLGGEEPAFLDFPLTLPIKNAMVFQKGIRPEEST